MDLALNNLKRLICHKTQQTKPIKLNPLFDPQGLTVSDLLTMTRYKIIISYLKPYNCVQTNDYFLNRIKLLSLH